MTRSSVHGLCQNPGTGENLRAILTAKVEYQPSFGAEMQTPQEKIYDWLTLFLKRAQIHCRGE